MTAKALLKAVHDKKHVSGLPWGHTTAVFVVNMTFSQVMRWLPKMKIYKSKKNKNT